MDDIIRIVKPIENLSVLIYGVSVNINSSVTRTKQNKLILLNFPIYDMKMSRFIQNQGESGLSGNILLFIDI